MVIVPIFEFQGGTVSWRDDHRSMWGFCFGANLSNGEVFAGSRHMAFMMHQINANETVKAFLERRPPSLEGR